MVLRLKTTSILVLNGLLSISTVFLNKWLYVDLNFPNLTLSCLHFAITFLCLYISEKFNFFTLKSVHWNEVIGLSAIFCALVVFMNLSLQYNSVETFLVTKILTSPCAMLMQAVYSRQKVSRAINISICIIILGVIANYYFDPFLNAVGATIALIGVAINILSLMLTKAKQVEFQMTSMQLLYYEAAISAVILIFVIPFVENPVPFILKNVDAFTWVYILISCISAFLYNATTYWIIRNTSPLKYNILGHIKFYVVIIIGCSFFDFPSDYKQLLAINIAAAGIVLYTLLKFQESKTTKIYSRLRSEI